MSTREIATSITCVYTCTYTSTYRNVDLSFIIYGTLGQYSGTGVQTIHSSLGLHIYTCMSSLCVNGGRYIVYTFIQLSWMS